MKATVHDISVRAGFELSFSDVLLMYEMCRFEVAHRNVSGWCGVFSQENLKVKSNILNPKYILEAFLTNNLNRLWNMTKTWKIGTNTDMEIQAIEWLPAL